MYHGVLPNLRNQHNACLPHLFIHHPQFDIQLRTRPYIHPRTTLTVIDDGPELPLKGEIITDGITQDLSPRSESSGNHSPWSEFSDDDNGTTDELAPTGSSESGESVDKFYIETYLKLLSKISIAIRKSGTKLRYSKADEYLKAHLDDEDYDQLRDHLLLLILVTPYEQSLMGELKNQASKGLIPGAVEIVVRSWIVDLARATPLQKCLIEKNVMRRNRIMYARYTDGTVKPPPKPEKVAPPVEQASIAPEVLPQPSIAPSQSAPYPEKPAKIEAPTEPPKSHVESIKTMTATEIGSQFILPNISMSKPAKTVSVVTKMTRTGDKQEYPPPPAGTGSFKCPYCVHVLTEDYRQRSRWR